MEEDRYMILRRNNTEDLSEAVNYRVKSRYQPIGGVSIESGLGLNDGKLFYLQAMFVPDN